MHMPDFDIFNDTSATYLNELKRMILECGERTEIAKGDYFVEAGKYCGRIAYICRGGFKCTCTDSRGRERIMSFMFDGEFTRTTYLRATAALRCWVFGRWRIPWCT